MPRPKPVNEKRCPDCGEVKGLDSFYRSEKYGGGCSTYCKPCTRAQTNERRSSDREHTRALNRSYYEQHKAERAESNRAKMRAYRERMRAEQPAKWRTRRFFGSGRSIDSDLTREYVEALFADTTHCTCCGRKLCLEYRGREDRGHRTQPDGPSIDRVNNDKPYTKANIAITCWECNFRKTDLTLADLEMFKSYIEKHGEFDEVQ